MSDTNLSMAAIARWLAGVPVDPEDGVLEVDWMQIPGGVGFNSRN
jgi:hypothetical protein